jgi:CRP-like cAMP-binding protein
VTTDVFMPNLTAAQWDMLGSYLQPFAVTGGQVLIQQGAEDRTLYIVETGNLTVHYEDSKGRVRLALVGPGSAVGEGAFFSRQPRSATVQAAATSKIWSMTPLRFSELSKRQPEVALEIAMALGSLVSRRLANRPRRVAVT